jgi:hypothetical protein
MKRSILVLAIVILSVVNASYGDKVRMSIENVGALPIWSAKITFDIAPRGLFEYPDLSYDCGIIFRYSGYPWPPLVEPLTLFERDEPIAPGEIYYTPVLPELEDVIFSVNETDFSGPWVATSAGQFWQPVILDESFLTEYNPVIDFGLTLRFHSVAPNLEPNANAGSDQTVFAALSGIALVALDGSASTDPDGDELFYYWYLNGELIVTGINPIIELPIGEHIIELIVNDGTTDSEPDYVEITVLTLAEQIETIIVNKLNLIEQINTILDNEHDVIDSLNTSAADGDYGSVKQGDVIKAKQKIHSAIQHQEQAIHDLENSIEKLTEALDSLGSPVEP